MTKVAGGSTLALHGGPPVRQTLLPYGRQSLTDEDVQAVVDVLRSDWITTGPLVEAFELAVADAVQARHAVSFSSGTAALHAAVFAAGLGPGDEAVTTPLTFCATANAVLYQGALPVFADVSPDTLTLDADAVASRIGPATKAILPVDYAGHAADLDALLALAARGKLIVIEDASHALGGRDRGRPIGSISHMTTFSFHPVKHITTGEGGMVTTDDPALAERLRLFRNHGIDRSARERQGGQSWQYDMRVLGYNYRLSDIGCALGRTQLARLPDNLRRRREIASRYNAGLCGVPGLRLPEVRPGVEHAWHLYPIRCDRTATSAGRDEILRALRVEGIGANVHYAPVHLHSYYRERFGYRPGHCPIAEDASADEISLPLFPGMTDSDVEDVLTAVTKVFGYWSA